MDHQEEVVEELVCAGTDEPEDVCDFACLECGRVNAKFHVNITTEAQHLKRDLCTH